MCLHVALILHILSIHSAKDCKLPARCMIYSYTSVRRTAPRVLHFSALVTMSNTLFHEVYSLMADTDECFEGLDFCVTHAKCTNTIGSYECTCIVGYSGTGYSCCKFVKQIIIINTIQNHKNRLH